MEALLAVSDETETTHSQHHHGRTVQVIEGHPIAVGLSHFPGSFPEIYRATVAAGEQSGHLDTVWKGFY